VKERKNGENVETGAGMILNPEWGLKFRAHARLRNRLSTDLGVSSDSRKNHCRQSR
jgi:nucleoid DNA-binding protein